MSNRFVDKVVMITGAAGNLGEGVLREFAAEGAKLVLVARNKEKLMQQIESMDIELGEYLLEKADLGVVEEVDALVKRVEDHFGKIDVLVHTAGGFDMGKPVHEAGIDIWERMMYLNARLTYVTLGRVAKHMVDNIVEGKIISVLARPGLKGSKNMSAYSASKAAAQRVIESMGAELKEHNINVNGVMPSIIDTPPNRKDMPNADFSKWVTPKMVADVILFLASDGAVSINGDSLEVYHKS